MRKFLIALLLSLSCSLTVAAVGCSEDEPSSVDSSVSSESVDSTSSESADSSSDSSVDSSSDSSSETPDITETCKVILPEGKGYFLEHEIPDTNQVAVGSSISFTVRKSVFYNGFPVVYVNGSAVTPTGTDEASATYTYNVTVDGETTITVDGVQKALSAMQGTGTLDDAFVVSQPIDLLYIAEQVNAGVQSYVNGMYVLANDIDCGGEELDIIGDYSNEAAYFSGCFSCITNPDTGEMERYTISNFTINSDDTNYVGLFGVVFANPSVTSSGLFYGIRIADYTMNLSANGLPTDQRSLICGSLIGYGSGVNLYLCDAENGNINVYADDNYFAYAGGLIGYQQGFYDSSYGAFFPSEVVYSTTDVDIRILSGLALYAGGITGYTASTYPIAATAYVHNSYALGDVTGALRAGGVVGGLGQYTSVSNCYATGSVIARATQEAGNVLSSSDEFCHAHAGGLVGYAENDTIVSDSFFAGTVSAYAVSGANYQHTDTAAAGGLDAYASSATSQEYIVYNCLENVTTQTLIDIDFLNENLGWAEFDWIFESGKYPTICYEPVATEETADFIINYVAKDGATVSVGGAASLSTQFFNSAASDSNIYVPIGNFFYNSSLQFYYEADNGYLSYGYYFDEACTQKVPYSFVATRTVNLYVGFADPTPILGEYQFMIDGNTKPLTLEFLADGRAIYSDGVTKQTTNFLFDGETIVIEAARLARYYDGEIIVDDTTIDANFDLNRYSFYDFSGYMENGTLYLQDGTYFTTSNPLVASKAVIVGEYYAKNGDEMTYYAFYGDSATVETVGEATYLYAEYDTVSVSGTSVTLSASNSAYPTVTVDISTLSEYDAFKGSWTKSATINKTYTFDGIGNWEFKHVAYESSGYSSVEMVISSAEGTYTYDGDSIRFTHDDVDFVASIVDGFLTIESASTTQTFHKEYSYTGIWSGGGLTLELLGIDENGKGNAIATYSDGNIYDLVYEISETTGYVCLYWPDENYWKEQLFGYFYRDNASNRLVAFVFDSNNMETGYTQIYMNVQDDYNGEWICNAPAFIDTEFSFDGNGLYSGYGYSGGTLILNTNGEITRVTYTLNADLTGSFAYNGVLYTISYDEISNCVTISTTDEDITLERKDIFAGAEFVDLNGNRYVFDGKSNHTSGGRIEVNGVETYCYKLGVDGFILFDLNNVEIGTISRGSTTYLLDANGVVTDLYMTNEFMGNWAMSGLFEIFEIGPTDLNGNVKAVFDGKNVTMRYISSTMLSFDYVSGNMPVVYYVFIMVDPYTYEPTLVLSQYTNLASGGYIICTKANDLFGTWVYNGDTGNVKTLVFDGVTSSYVNGTVKMTEGRYSTLYNYTIKDNGIMMWSQDLLGGKTWYYKLEIVDLADCPEAATDPNAYICGNRAMYRTEVDGLYLTEARAENGDNYFFDGEGNIFCGEEIVYTYVLKSYNTNDTATLHVTDENGVTYEATLNYQDASDIYFILGEEIVEENA